MSAVLSSVQVVTTTIFSSSPSSTSGSRPSPSSSTANVPFASIIGGSVAGIFLAIIAVVGWKLWGRSIKRKNEILRKEAMSKYTTRENTRRNASLSAPNISTRHIFATPQERKVQFTFLPTSSEKDIEKAAEPLRTSDLFMTPSLPLRSQPWSPPPGESETRPFLNPSSQLLHSLPGPSSLQSPILQVPASLAHKASVTSSLSAYSTQSGEPHQTRPPRYFLARKFDSKRLSNFTRSTRTVSRYSALNDVSEHPNSAHELDEET